MSFSVKKAIRDFNFRCALKLMRMAQMTEEEIPLYIDLVMEREYEKVKKKYFNKVKKKYKKKLQKHKISRGQYFSGIAFETHELWKAHAVRKIILFPPVLKMEKERRSL